MTGNRSVLSTEVVLEVAARFGLGRVPAVVHELRSGLINDSWVVGRGGRRRGLLQRINRHVFAEPRRLMDNVERITRHLAHRLGPNSQRRRLTLIPTDNGRTWVDIGHGHPAAGCWRMYELIEDAKSETRASSTEQAFGAAQAFGHFQCLLADLPPPPLFETVPRFHDTVSRFEALDRVLDAEPPSAEAAQRRKQAGAEIRQAAAHRGLASRLIEAAARGLPRRTVHNDCKIDNVLFDRKTGEALCVVDLDTAMPGLAAFDFGDMARSMAHRSEEDAVDPESVEVDLELFAALAAGYLDGACFLTPEERRSLVDGALVLTLQQAVRFLTDHLQGDVYFRVERPGQNLDRSRVQLALLDSLVARSRDLQRIVGGS